MSTTVIGPEYTEQIIQFACKNKRGRKCPGRLKLAEKALKRSFLQIIVYSFVFCVFFDIFHKFLNFSYKFKTMSNQIIYSFYIPCAEVF